MNARVSTHPAKVAALAWAIACGLAAPAAASVSYSGRAYADRVILVNPQPNVLVFSDTGELQPPGGTLSATLLTVLLGNTLSSHTVTATTSGANDVAMSQAHQEDLVVFSGQPAEVTADVVEAHSQATCTGVQGSSVVVGLTFGGSSVTVSGQPNQTVVIANVATLVINEQIVTSGVREITVNALHLYLGTGEEVIVSSARSGVACPTPARMVRWGSVKALYR